jgi:hypothetical protein
MAYTGNGLGSYAPPPPAFSSLPSSGPSSFGPLPTFPDMESFNAFMAKMNAIQGAGAPIPAPAAPIPGAFSLAPPPAAPQWPSFDPTAANGSSAPAFETQSTVKGSTTYVDVESDSQLLAGGVVKFCTDEEMRMALASTFQLLKTDVLLWLQPDADGVVRIAVPFCGGFLECGALDEFLKDLLPSLPHVAAIHVHAHDTMHTADASIAAVEPNDRIRYEASYLNLQVQRMPPAAVAFGFHPGVTAYGWDSILRNVVTHSKIAFFFLFAQCEHEELQRICQQANYHCVVKQNPFARVQFAPRGVPIDDLKRYNWLALVRKD